jgi:hypothetical protein
VIFDPSGRVFVTPECATYEEIERQINSLQDELDELRETVRCHPFLDAGIAISLILSRSLAPAPTDEQELSHRAYPNMQH